MSIKLNQEGLKWAQNRIEAGEVDTLPASWTAHKATQDEKAKYLETHYTKDEYGQWFLGINTDVPENTKEHYVFPFGDLKMVHKEALKSAEISAREQNLQEIADAARQLLDMVDQTEH